MKSFSTSLYQFADTLENLNALTSSEQKIIGNNIVFKDVHHNKRAFILANGPSLAALDLSLLRNDITFAMNSFYKHPLVGEWQPSYYCLLDFLYFQDNENSYPFYEELTKVITGSTFFLPLARGYGYMEKHKQIRNNKIYYCATYGSQIGNHIDLTKQIMGFQTVAAFSIAIAMYMGCNPIYLLGFDHDYLANQGRDHHFYQGHDKLKGSHATDIQNKNVLDIYSYDYMMQCMLKFWENYRALENIANKTNLKIINATPGGYLDVFPRIKYMDIFKTPVQ